ncbi:MAG: autotransporter domain-containing protein, partial [Zoogloeaceae bacterium]|nr:autotransporter domain-containing protein [Zoogloeaceae bacterium]
DVSALKFYGQYLWSRQDGDKVTLANGDPVKFESVNSHRTRLGAKWEYAVNKNATAWLGAAWEHEFDGKAKARYYDDPIDAPKLKGDTGMLEVGLTLTPAPNQPLTLDFGLQGYTGKREGATGSFRVNYAF